MRVIAGTAKSRKLVAPKGQRVRPTADRVKESLFNIIGGDVIDTCVLDLYAGVGSLAIEALSRGAASATLVDNAAQSIQAIERNLNSTGLMERARVVKAPVLQVLKRLAKQRPSSFDLIFLDPPYRIEQAELEAVLEIAAECVNQTGRLILESQAGLPEPSASKNMVQVDKRGYGDTSLIFFKKRED